jgi:hypothetical protein
MATTDKSGVRLSVLKENSPQEPVANKARTNPEAICNPYLERADTSEKNMDRQNVSQDGLAVCILR